MNRQRILVWPGQTKFWAVGVLLALVLSALVYRAWYEMLDPVEKFYWKAYVKASYAPESPKFTGRPRDTRQIVAMLYSGNLPAVPGNTAATHVVALQMERAAFATWVQKWIFDGKTPINVASSPLFCLPLFLIGGIALGRYFDFRWNQKVRNGLVQAGPELVRRRRFNRLVGGNGLRLRVKGGVVRIPRSKEAQHGQIHGDTGAGKSTLLREILYQVEARGDTAIVLDLSGEFTREFYQPERGDFILNPTDERCPVWEIGREATDIATATAVALAFYPYHPLESRYFIEQSRDILAFLLTKHPSTAQLADWLSDDEAMDREVIGTKHETSLTENAAPQRAGILSTMNRIEPALRMMPSDIRRPFSVTDWNRTRKGWIFLTSTARTLDAVRPIQSAVLDLLILSLQSKDDSKPRVWTVLDELAALNQLPQLQNGMTRLRKSGNPMLLGLQGMAQVEYLYGQKPAETILSQAALNIILKTSESNAAKHLEKMIGDQELVRVSERHGGVRGDISWNRETVTKPLIIASEIQSLDDLSGYLKLGRYVVKIDFERREPRNMAAAWIERVIPEEKPREAKKKMLKPTPVEQPMPVKPRSPRRPTVRTDQAELEFLREVTPEVVVAK